MNDELNLQILEFASSLEGDPLQHFYKHRLLGIISGEAELFWEPKRNWRGRIMP